MTGDAPVTQQQSERLLPFRRILTSSRNPREKSQCIRCEVYPGQQWLPGSQSGREEVHHEINESAPELLCDR